MRLSQLPVSLQARKYANGIQQQVQCKGINYSNIIFKLKQDKKRDKLQRSHCATERSHRCLQERVQPRRSAQVQDGKVCRLNKCDSAQFQNQIKKSQENEQRWALSLELLVLRAESQKLKAELGVCRQQEIEKELAAEQHKMELQTQIKLVEEVQYMREQVRMKLEEHDELVTEDREERSEEEIIQITNQLKSNITTLRAQCEREFEEKNILLGKLNNWRKMKDNLRKQRQEKQGQIQRGKDENTLIMESIEAQNQQYCLAQERYFKLNDNSENLIRYGSLDLPEEIQLIRRKKLLLAEEMSRLKRDNDQGVSEEPELSFEEHKDNIASLATIVKGLKKIKQQRQKLEEERPRLIEKLCKQKNEQQAQKVKLQKNLDKLRKAQYELEKQVEELSEKEEAIKLKISRCQVKEQELVRDSSPVSLNNRQDKAGNKLVDGKGLKGRQKKNKQQAIRSAEYAVTDCKACQMQQSSKPKKSIVKGQERGSLPKAKQRFRNTARAVAISFTLLGATLIYRFSNG